MEQNSYIEALCKNAKEASRSVALLSSNERNARCARWPVA
jgi:hypothetical protein